VRKVHMQILQIRTRTREMKRRPAPMMELVSANGSCCWALYGSNERVVVIDVYMYNLEKMLDCIWHRSVSKSSR